MIHKPMLGWREWVALPELKLAEIKAKIDTGARSSALHAFAIEPYRKGGQRWVMFAIHPLQKRCDVSVECHAPVKDRRHGYGFRRTQAASLCDRNPDGSGAVGDKG